MPVLYWFSRRMSLWGTISFNLAVFINLIIAFFYPYNSGQGVDFSKVVVLQTNKQHRAVHRSGVLKLI